MSFYFPHDTRAAYFAKEGIDQIPCLPLLEDSTKVSREPPLREKRDEYSYNVRPLKLLMDAVWVMSARYAAWDSRVLLRNGISAIACVAPGNEAHRRDKRIEYMESVDANAFFEGNVPVQVLF